MGRLSPDLVEAGSDGCGLCIDFGLHDTSGTTDGGVCGCDVGCVSLADGSNVLALLSCVLGGSHVSADAF